MLSEGKYQLTPQPTSTIKEVEGKVMRKTVNFKSSVGWLPKVSFRLGWGAQLIVEGDAQNCQLSGSALGCTVASRRG